MKMTKPKETKKPKTMPLAIMISVGKPKMRPMPMRGQRTRTNARTRKGPRKAAQALKK